MIRVTCPQCQSKLNAKDEILGQVRKCPKCGTPVRIERQPAAETPILPVPAAAPGGEAPVPLAATTEAAVASQEIHSISKGGLPPRDAPERLDRQSHYLICDKAKLVAAWQNDGHGWMLKASFGMISASRNYEQLPAQGDFKLVELKLVMDDGLKLAGLTTYQLAKRYALTNLDKGDDKILACVTGYGALNREQKNVVRNLIKDQFMRHVWEHADRVLEYLANTDFHSPGPS